jgi:RNA polymerase sigma-70 factor (ECF subfamily)
MEKQNNFNITDTVDHLFRREAGKMTAILTRIFGFTHARMIEDIVQEAFFAALKTWPIKGKPNKPSAWLMQVAKNKTINAIKRDRRFISNTVIQQQLNDKNSEPEHVLNSLFLDHEIKDSRLRILFACCNPDISSQKQIALTLKTLGGFSNTEISRALLMSEPAVKKMIYRARKSIRDKRLSLDVPFIDQTEELLHPAQTTCYLIFNEGYKRSSGDHMIKEDLCREAIRLARLLTELPKGASKSAALLSLMLFNAARFPARVDEDRHPVDIENQNRDLWDSELIQKGFYYLKKSREAKSMSSYHLEAGIAGIHCSAKTYGDTDWSAIVTCYRKLDSIRESPVIKLNYAIALSKLEGPEAGLKVIDQSGLQKPLEHYELFYAAKADMYFRLTNYPKAKAYYQLALDLTNTEADKWFIKSKIEKCDLIDMNRN